MTKTSLLAAACAPLLITFSLAAPAKPAPPSLAKELPVCEKLHGTAPKLPVATDFPGGLSPKAGALTPAELPGVRTVNPKVVACLIDAMGSELAVFAPMKDETGIPDAFAWPGVGLGREPTAEEKETLAEVFRALSGGRKDRPIVVYCHSTECFLSWNALIHLQNAGYTNLLWMREGIKGWKEAGLPVDHVRMQGTRKLPPADIPPGTWDAFGMRNYPTPPRRYARERWEPFREATGVRRDVLCLTVGPDSDDLDDFDKHFHKAAGIDPNVDNEVVTRRKAQAFFAKWGDVLECSEMAFGYRHLFKYAVNKGQHALVLRAADEWKLPPEAFNHVDPSDGRTLLDFVIGKHHENPGSSSHVRLYRVLRKAGAKTRAELEAEGKIKPPDVLQAEVLQLHRRAAEAGDIDSMFHLSHVYRNGDHVPVNRDEGMKWWHRAGARAQETNAWSTMVHIGTAHYFAEPDKNPGSVPKDYAAAARWFQAASKGDTKESNFWMGRMYLHAIGVPKDIRRAVPYLERALEQGDDIALKWLIEAWIDLGDKNKAAYYMRSWPMVQDIKGRQNREWFSILGVKFCGPRAQLPEIVCDGTNDKPPDLF